MQDLTWFDRDGYIVGIDTSFDPQAIADCLSASLPIPLQTKAQFSDDGMSVYLYFFKRIPRPQDWYRKDQFFRNAALHCTSLNFPF